MPNKTQVGNRNKSKAVPRHNFSVACGRYDDPKGDKYWVYVIVYLTNQADYIEVDYAQKDKDSINVCLTPAEFTGGKFDDLIRHFNLHWMVELIALEGADKIRPMTLFEAFKRSHGMIRNG